MEQEINRLQNDTSTKEDLVIKGRQMQDEVTLLRKQIAHLSMMKEQMKSDMDTNYRSEDFKQGRLQQALAKVQGLHRLKCREVEELTASQNALEAKMKEMEAGRDSWRSQYLEIREINKDIEQKVKALQKQLNAQLRIGKENLNNSC